MADRFINAEQLPKNLEAEAALLGAIFLSPDVINEVLELIEPLDFYSRQNKTIFQAMIELNKNNDKIDVVTVEERLTAKNQLDDAGGYEYLFKLYQAEPTATSALSYAKIVQEKSVRRSLIAAAQEIFAVAQNEDQGVSGLLDLAEKKISYIAEQKSDGSFRKISDVVEEVYAETSQRSKQTDEIIGLSTGYSQLDHVTAGLQADNLIIIAARPAVGKTAFVLNIAQNVAKENDVAVAIFSLEMGAESLVRRMLAAEGSINASNLQNGNLSTEEWHSLAVSAEALKQTSIYIDDTPGIKMAAIRARCRALAKKNPLGLIVIDYLQLIEGSNKESRQQEVSEISRELKKLAKELSVPVIALSQLSRGVEQRQDKRPVLSDIRESGAIEQDADIVAFLYRDDYYERAEGDDDEAEAMPNQMQNPDAGVVELIIEKNRAGARGTIKLLFNKTCYKFSNLSYAQEPPL